MKLEKNNFSGYTYSATLPEFLKFLLLLHLSTVQGGNQRLLKWRKRVILSPLGKNQGSAARNV